MWWAGGQRARVRPQLFLFLFFFASWAISGISPSHALAALGKNRITVHAQALEKEGACGWSVEIPGGIDLTSHLPPGVQIRPVTNQILSFFHRELDEPINEEITARIEKLAADYKGVAPARLGIIFCVERLFFSELGFKDLSQPFARLDEILETQPELNHRALIAILYNEYALNRKLTPTEIEELKTISETHPIYRGTELGVVYRVQKLIGADLLKKPKLTQGLARVHQDHRPKLMKENTANITNFRYTDRNIDLIASDLREGGFRDSEVETIIHAWSNDTKNDAFH